MDDYFNLFDKLVSDQENKQLIQNDLISLIENCCKELETSKNSVQNLQMQLKTLTKAETFGITSRYVELKKSYEDLQTKYEALKNENEDLLIQSITREEELKQEFSQEKLNIEISYKHKLKEKDDEIKSVLSNCAIEKQELINEMHIKESTAALELDQVESDLKKRLNESVQSLRDNINTSNVLRTELRRVKEQLASYKNSSNEKIAALQQRLEQSTTFNNDDLNEESITESFNNYFYDSATPALIPRFENHEAGDGNLPNISCLQNTQNGNNVHNKYQPLDVSTLNRNSFTQIAHSRNNPKTATTPVFRGSRNWGEKSLKKNQNVPPLIGLSSAPKVIRTQKKRKLYNPDDLRYLEEDEDLCK